MNPTISVIIPFYNAEQYLKECIDSILKQTYPYLEIILINDGSTDQSAQLCRDYEQLDSRISVINQSNSGVSHARNTGLNNASGEWISFVDADDWLDSSAFEWAIHVQKINNADIVLWNRIDEFEHKSVPCFYADDKLAVSGEECFEAFKLRIFTGYTTSGKRDHNQQNVYGKIIRKKILDNIRFDEKLKHHEDIFFMLEVYEKSSKAYLENKLFYHRRIHSDSAIHNFCPEITENNKLISFKYKDFLEKNNKSIKYYDFWKGLHVHWLIQTFSLYLFHPDNTMCFTDKLRYIRSLLENEPYNSIFKKMPKNIRFSKKIFFKIARHKWTILLLLYSKLYTTLKNR